jgi:hypothetical protein
MDPLNRTGATPRNRPTEPVQRLATDPPGSQPTYTQFHTPRSDNVRSGRTSSIRGVKRRKYKTERTLTQRAHGDQGANPGRCGEASELYRVAGPSLGTMSLAIPALWIPQSDLHNIWHDCGRPAPPYASQFDPSAFNCCAHTLNALSGLSLYDTLTLSTLTICSSS